MNLNAPPWHIDAVAGEGAHKGASTYMSRCANLLTSVARLSETKYYAFPTLTGTRSGYGRTRPHRTTAKTDSAAPSRSRWLGWPP